LLLGCCQCGNETTYFRIEGTQTEATAAKYIIYYYCYVYNFHGMPAHALLFILIFVVYYASPVKTKKGGDVQEYLARVQELFGSLDAVPAWALRYVAPIIVVALVAMAMGNRARKGKPVHRTLIVLWMVVLSGIVWMFRLPMWWAALWWIPVAIIMLDTRPRKPRTTSLQQMLDAG
jgi:hypothetical protein